MALIPKKKKPKDDTQAQEDSGVVSSNTASGEPSKVMALLFPAITDLNPRQSRMVDLPSSSAGYFGGYIQGNGSDWSGNPIFAVSGDDEDVVHSLPEERVARYDVFDLMASDPTIDCAVKMHIAHALSARPDDGEIFDIESVTDADDPIVNDLRQTLKPMLHRELHELATGAAIHGVHYVRAYGEQGVGLTRIRSDYYTHPRFVKEYERAGQLAGFCSAHQGTIRRGEISLLPPWMFVAFKIPAWKVAPNIEPMRVDQTPVDIENEDMAAESLVETQDYGSSLIETAYSSWIDLLEAIVSLNMSRKNAARLERIIGINTGRMEPQKASQYLNLVANQIKKTDKATAKQSWLKGKVQTVLNHLIPIFGDVKGRLDINSIQGTPDIQGIDDVMFHIKRLGSALGVDPSLLGFGDLMSGGLGDGGFFRVSIMAAIKAQMLRAAMKNGIERLIDIHVAYKYGKVFLPGERPYKLMFHSISTALEREEQENKEARANLATGFATVFATLDAEFQVTDRRGLMNYLLTNVLKMDEETFKNVCPENYKPPTPPGMEDQGGGGSGGGGGGMFESAAMNDLPPELREQLYNLITDFYVATA